MFKPQPISPDAEAGPAPANPSGGTTNPPVADKLISWREVNEKIGSAAKTSHTARSLARRGLIRAVRVNSRVVRFSAQSVADLVGGRLRA
jgi:hypothetical protein